ncbi:hypothetical protein QTG94_10935 [Clostridium perfringens]|uniref:hypothetical protein n=1 Tax=Clostridium perfringens TaxID=1502 RepID=UPI0013E33EDA|nr:hypothetical protein [Clostridium perfringens]EJT6341597.1 hypothetical protein [Clostridium perfringens]MDM0551721.1 hypothetical protein [Clostridium perfringens]MDM0877470.1 hypothetical protein [Clostridium perfringens]NGU12122.1 hypothetical protein [Clostridium perfringens]
MSLYFAFNKQLEVDMNNIRMNLRKENAIKLVFDKDKVASKYNTNLLYVDGIRVPDDYKFSFDENNNVYFMFDENFKCQYVGKKNGGINTRLGLHLLKNVKENPASAIKSICEYLNSIKNRDRVIYLITITIKQSYMAEGVESYFIDYFRANKLATWVKRK